MHLPSELPHVRQIVDTDVTAAINLLSQGFPTRNRAYWAKGFERLASRSVPSGVPKYGYAIAADNELVGIILLISASMPVGETWAVRSNLSSWFVKLPFRYLSTLLIKRAINIPESTYINISAARYTWRTIEAQGFSRYSDGQFIALPIARAPDRKLRIIDAAAECCESFEHRLLLDHSKYGCISLWCCTPDGDYPFVFLPRTVNGFIPCAQLIYCRNLEEYVRFARPLGWYLAGRGRLFTIIDSNGRVKGLTGRYFPNSAPKYFKGPIRPRLGDLSYTEAPLFGL
jgi:hypothetical protein